MTDIAALASSDSIPQQPQTKPKRIAPRIRQAIDLLVTGKCSTQRAAAERVNLSEEHLCRELRKPQVRVFIERTARDNLGLGVLRASNRTIALIDAISEHVSLDASKHVLAIAGIKPANDAQLSVNIDIKAGYVIDIRDDISPPVRTIDHEPT